MIDTGNLFPETPEGIKQAIDAANDGQHWEGLVDWWGESDPSGKQPDAEAEAVLIALAIAIKDNPSAFTPDVKASINKDMQERQIRLHRPIDPANFGSKPDVIVIRAGKINEVRHNLPA